MSLTQKLQNIDENEGPPKEELVLSKLVEEDENLRNWVLQMIL